MTIMMEIGIVHPPFYFLKVSKIILGHFPFLQLWFVNSFKASAAMRPDYKRVNQNLRLIIFILRLKSRCGLVLPPSMTDGGPSGERRSKKLRERIMQKLPQN